MEDIRIYKNIDITKPVMITAWPGMGNVALGVADYLKRKLPTVKFAEIKTDPKASLDSVVVEGGLAALPPAPRNTFYYAKGPNLMIFEGEAQLPGEGGLAVLNKVLDVAVKYRVERIYASAAFPLPVSHKEEPAVYGAVNESGLMTELLKRFGVVPMDSGHIAGLNGLILGFAKERSIGAACLLATMPQYAISLPNPKASGAIIGVLKNILKLDIDMKGMEGYIREMDEKMAIIEDKVKDTLILDGKGVFPSRPAEKKIPAYIKEKIEKLFLEARADRTKALVLKKELDRWDLYKAYEDRFLDLFAGGQ